MLIKSVCVGSKNPIKFAAAKRVMARYAMLERVEFTSAAVPSGVPAQPRGVEVWYGAHARAKGAFYVLGATVGLGLESGIFETPFGWMDACACVIYGKRGVLGAGLSSAFEVPPRVVARMGEGLEMCDALAALGLAPADAGRCGTGASGVVTRDRVTRAHQVEQAVVMAMSRLDCADIYRA